MVMQWRSSPGQGDPKHLLAGSLHQPLEDHAVLTVWLLADFHHPGKFPASAAEAVQPPFKGLHVVRCFCPFFNLVFPRLSHVPKRRSGRQESRGLPAAPGPGRSATRYPVAGSTAGRTWVDYMRMGSANRAGRRSVPKSRPEEPPSV